MKSPRIKRFLEEERIEGEKESVLPIVGKERIGEAYTLRNDIEEELLREMFTFTYSEYGPCEKRVEVESSEKDRPCLTKMTTLTLACVALEERTPNREWVQSERRAENPGIRKEEDELRLDSWIQIRSTGWDQRK